MEVAETKTITVSLNGEPRPIPQGFHVAELLEFLAIDPARVAVELNRANVRKQDWSTAIVEDGAELEVVWFVGGGNSRTQSGATQSTATRSLPGSPSPRDNTGAMRQSEVTMKASPKRPRERP